MNNYELQKKWREVFILVIILSFIPVKAYAGVIVTEWDFDTWAEFTASGFSAGTGTTTSDLYELSWGDGGGDFTTPTSTPSDNRSALTVGTGTSGDSRFGGGHATGEVMTILGGGAPTPPSEIGLGISMTHWNNTISGSFSTLGSGTLTDHLTLAAKTPFVGAVEPAPTIDIIFKFLETPNSGSGGECLDGSLVSDHSGGCGDLFGIDGLSTVGIPFYYDGNTYGLDVLVFDEFGGAAPIAALGEGYCTALGLSSTCVGFVTPESEHTSLQFGFTVRHVPEPNTIALFALALIFLANKRYLVK